KLNDEQRARLEATIKMYDASKDSLVAMVALRARLQVDVGVMRQLGEDVPKVTAAMDTALEFALEKVDDFAKRRDKGEDAGLPERIAITILENVQDAFGNLKKDTEKILNDAKRTPKHYQDEFRRLNDNLAAACAGFEDTASQAGALHASNLKAAKSYGDEQGVIKAGLMSQTNMVNIKFKKVVRVNISYGHNGSSRVGELAVQASRTTIIIK
ncbi:hypothetical protein HQ560_03410, partial [bacterium]|nr:hypothetical protein [bacterium]